MGDNMRRERIRQGLSVDEAARAILIPTSELAAIERGEREIYASELVRMSRLYGCSPDFLLGMTDERRAGLIDG